MRGWIFSSLLAVALIATPLWAQRGGAGGHGGFGGGHGFSGGGHPGAPSGSHPPGGGNGWHGNGNGWGLHGNGWRGYPYRFSGWRGYPGWGYGGYGYPYWGGYGWYDFDDYPSYDQSYGPGYLPPYGSSYSYAPPSGAAVSYATEGEVERIQNEVAQLRAQQATRYAEPAHPATVLIYRDGHKETVENYAVVDSTVWIFNQDRARKVPLSELNVPETQRDNEARGGEFVLPESH